MNFPIPILNLIFLLNFHIKSTSLELNFRSKCNNPSIVTIFRIPKYITSSGKVPTRVSYQICDKIISNKNFRNRRQNSNFKNKKPSIEAEEQNTPRKYTFNGNFPIFIENRVPLLPYFNQYPDYFYNYNSNQITTSSTSTTTTLKPSSATTTSTTTRKYPYFWYGFPNFDFPSTILIPPTPKTTTKPSQQNNLITGDKNGPSSTSSILLQMPYQMIIVLIAFSVGLGFGLGPFLIVRMVMSTLSQILQPLTTAIITIFMQTMLSTLTPTSTTTTTTTFRPSSTISASTTTKSPFIPIIITGMFE